MAQQEEACCKADDLSSIPGPTQWKREREATPKSYLLTSTPLYVPWYIYPLHMEIKCQFIVYLFIVCVNTCTSACNGILVEGQRAT